MKNVPIANLMRPAGAHTNCQPIRWVRLGAPSFPPATFIRASGAEPTPPARDCRFAALGCAAEMVNEKEVKKSRELLRLSRGQPESGQFLPSSFRYSLSDPS